MSTSMFGRHNRSNLKSAHKWNLNNAVELQKLKKEVFARNAATKQAFDKADSAVTNYAKMGFAYKLGDDRAALNLQASREREEKRNKELPKPVELDIPEALGKRKDGYMMKEWDYDYARVLVEAHGTNYKAMSRDLKRNWQQKSEGEMRRMAEQYVEFRGRGEAKLEEYTKELEEQTKKEHIGTVLGAPASILENSKTQENTQTPEKTNNKPNNKKDSKTDKPTTNTKTTVTNDKDTKNKRKREEENTDETATKPQKSTKQTKKEPAKQAENGKDAQVKTATQNTPKTKTKETATLTPKVSKETPKTTKAKTAKPETTKAKTKEPATQKETTTKQGDKKQATNKSKKEAPKPSAGSDDSDLEGLEFDFDGMSSDDE
eukprot:Phypoly_transcript_11507.p1 GENE.Phypoly_transcript_11507~~Phypoly_transcript_11507.p1  ORF type:complete len:400 (-),score=122.98 Phypoly_transcript_11507:12-1139(-)